MRIAVAADERVGVAEAVVAELRKRGHDVLAHGALNADERDDWAWASEAAARDVAEGRAEQAVVCCWTGTGASIAFRGLRLAPGNAAARSRPTARMSASEAAWVGTGSTISVAVCGGSSIRGRWRRCAARAPRV